MEEQKLLDRLEKAIENELYILGLQRLANPKKYCTDYTIGYIRALVNVRDKIKEIR